MSELLAPAGDFQTAINAFEAGADAIYLGLKQFSARKSATNFSHEDFRRVRAYALTQNKKIYVTLNTLIRESELSELYKTLSFLSDCKVDAVIIQDMGLLHFIKKHFPEMEIHASTQMGIHNLSGAKEAFALGIKRVVLSRELSYDEIIFIKKSLPELELEVFIHGALCYSFSGCCLASGLLLNRSGNKGACAQMCRSYYGHEDNYRYFFSCNDYVLSDDIKKLRDAGIDSFKIEGRMKEREYVDATVHLYKRILLSKSLSSTDLKALEDRVALTFSRKKSKAFFHHTKGIELIDSEYSGHKGLELGKVVEIRKSEICVLLKEHIKQNDSILFFKNGINKIRFTAFTIKDQKGLKLKAGKPGMRVWLTMPSNDLPILNEPCYLIETGRESKPDRDYKLYPMYKQKAQCDVTLSDSVLTITSNSSLITLNKSYDVITDESKSDESFISKLNKLFLESGDSFYTFSVDKFINNSSRQNPFLPPSMLKKIKNEFYAQFDQLAAEQKKQVVTYQMSTQQYDKKDWHSDRHLFTRDSDLPFIISSKLKISDLKEIDGYLLLPLNPIAKKEETYFSAIENLLQDNPQSKFLVGINNLSHMHYAKRWLQQSHVYFYLDYFSYIANSYTLDYYQSILQTKILFAYSWVEDRDNPLSLTPILKRSSLPLFLSLVCFKKHNNFGTCDKCDRAKSEYVLKNGPRNFKVVVKDCYSLMFLMES